MINDQGTQLKAVTERTLDDVKREYAAICGSAGDMGYLVKEMEAKLDIMHQKLFELKKEYADLETKAPVPEGHPFDGTKAP